MRNIKFIKAYSEDVITPFNVMALKDVPCVELVGVFYRVANLETRDGMREHGIYLGEVRDARICVPEIVIEDDAYVLVFNRTR